METNLAGFVLVYSKNTSNNPSLHARWSPLLKKCFVASYISETTGHTLMKFTYCKILRINFSSMYYLS